MDAKNFLLVTKAEAVARGLYRYFTGLPCKRGHVSERRTSSNDCIECSKLRQQTDEIRQYKKDCYVKNRDRALMLAKENYNQNRSEKIAYAIEYQRKNMKKIYQRNKVSIQKNIQNKPWITIHLRLRTGIGSALKRVVAQKKSRTMEIVGCSQEQLKAHIERQFLKGMTWKNRHLWHIDHIVPISKATCEQDVISLYHFTNLRPMWAVDNIRKSNKEMFLL